jgi:hypothetical protein
MGAAQQLKRIFNEGFNATTPTDAASTTGSVAAMVKALVAQIIGTTNPSAVTADAAGSVLERLQYVTDNTGIGLKKSSSTGQAVLPDGAPVTPTSNVGAGGWGAWVEVRSASGNAIYIKELLTHYVSNSAGRTYAQIQIGTGGAGSESVVGTVSVPLYSGSSWPGAGPTIPLFPLIAVAASTRIAVRHRDSVGDASSSATVGLGVIDQANVVPA